MKASPKPRHRWLGDECPDCGLRKQFEPGFDGASVIRYKRPPKGILFDFEPPCEPHLKPPDRGGLLPRGRR